MGLTSCDGLLDLTPKSEISQNDYFKTESDLQLFSNSFYNNLLDKSPFDDQSDLYVQQNLSDEMLGGNNRTVPASGGGWTWTDLRKMNTLLAYVHQCSDENAVVKYTALTRFSVRSSISRKSNASAMCPGTTWNWVLPTRHCTSRVTRVSW